MINSYGKVNQMLKKTEGTINAINKRDNRYAAPQTLFNYDIKIYKTSKSIANEPVIEVLKVVNSSPNKILMDHSGNNFNIYTFSILCFF